jgi:hypothetical protein
MQDGGRHGQSERLREKYRADLLRVLAYANLASARQVEEVAGPIRGEV